MAIDARKDPGTAPGAIARIAGQLDIEVSAMGAWHETYRGALGADRTADPLDHLRGTAPGGSTRIERDADPDLPRTAYPEGRH